jgi:hypothetical protein
MERFPGRRVSVAGIETEADGGGTEITRPPARPAFPGAARS